jgi:outer membrane protein assembly factor BamB
LAPTPSTSPQPVSSGPFAGGVLIADRGNGRLLIVNSKGRIVWQFPVAGSLPKGQGFSADDAFVSPDGKSISANEEQRQVAVRIDIASRKIVWEYGHYYAAGSRPGYLNTPDDAYPLANGDVVIADIFNCRVIEVSPAKKIVRQWGQTRVCSHRPPFSYNEPNGDTPLPDGGLLITEIRGSRVVRLDAAGKVIFDIHVPTVYPSDAQLDSQGNVVVADYTNPGAVISVSPQGKLLWRYGPRAGPGRLDHPSLAVPRTDGTVVLNDDFRHRVLLINPRTGKILWQYGVTDVRGTGPNHLYIPDGLDQVPAGTVPGV